MCSSHRRRNQEHQAIRRFAGSGHRCDQLLLIDHKVIFFRNQSHLDDAEQERFASRLGKLLPHPRATTKGKALIELDSTRGFSRANLWHPDGTFLDAYFKIQVLRGVVIPQFGGDTIWSNTAAAYLGLSPQLQRLADQPGLPTATTSISQNSLRAREVDHKHFDEVHIRTIFEAEHPVVRVHPETEERALVLCCFVQRFVDIPKYDCQRLFELLQSHIASPENTVRWSWK